MTRTVIQRAQVRLTSAFVVRLLAVSFGAHSSSTETFVAFCKLCPYCGCQPVWQLFPEEQGRVFYSLVAGKHRCCRPCCAEVVKALALMIPWFLHHPNEWLRASYLTALNVQFLILQKTCAEAPWQQNCTAGFLCCFPFNSLLFGGLLVLEGLLQRWGVAVAHCEDKHTGSRSLGSTPWREPSQSPPLAPVGNCPGGAILKLHQRAG